MAAIDTLGDALALFLSGGASNRDPKLCLGGAQSARRVRGWGALVDYPIIPAIWIQDVSPNNGEGSGQIAVKSDGSLAWTPPGGGEGAPVPVASGDAAILPGASTDKYARVQLEFGLPAPPNSSEAVELVVTVDGPLSHSDVTNADRIAGLTTYRAVMLAATGKFGLQDVRLWFPPVSGAQATFSVGVEDPVAGSIQTIASETTAPSGIVFSTPTSEGSALVIPAVSAGSFKGLWIRRVFPLFGSMNLLERVDLSVKFKAA